MFKMTADVLIGPFKAVKPSSLTWERHVDNISDTGTLVLPGICRVICIDRTNYDKEIVPTGQQFTEGMPITMMAGYDGYNNQVFKGFIKRINFKIPLEVECEGYAYQLRKLQFSKSYSNTTVRQICQDLIQGTDIKLSDKIPNIPIQKVWFQNYTRLQVLEYLKEKCLLTVYFNFDELYVGLKAGELKQIVNHRINWNVIKGDDLQFNADKEFATVNIKVQKRSSTGHRKTGKASVVHPGNEKVLKISLIEDEAVLKQIAEEEKKRLNNRGYSGKITTFLIPYAEPGMTSNITDKIYPERSGRYFIEGVDGNFSQHGGRQTISIGFGLGKGNNLQSG